MILSQTSRSRSRHSICRRSLALAGSAPMQGSATFSRQAASYFSGAKSVFLSPVRQELMTATSLASGVSA